ncbi:MAG: 2-oxoacid:ferredoxin oxidoreductase subunit beta [Planctomycetes bacterium]|nr:2-oxoacid:ferredoxin oxidoreductase subunit beta [Planctomycetota bacterium]MCB9830799.1 2-oxoacid:ferredoxin oxidoreductase subunit beta [Planctomycetota bacterium]
MADVETQEAPARGPKSNRIGLQVADYKGQPSTLCKGCGHDVITNTIVSAFYEMSVEPHRVAKLSGIGCSSKTPAYFLNQAWGFNSVHGRMPSVATGAALANRSLVQIGVSGDGDTASIGLGQFMHAVRRNIPIVYIVENNGVYGLTKGQFSATADEGSKLKNGSINELPPIDLCAVALDLGCGFVARSFSADRKQLLELLKAAIAYPGTAVLDVLSPCVTFNNHEGSTKSYDYGRDHEGRVHELGFVPSWDVPDTTFKEGEHVEVPMPDGGSVWIRRLDESMHDPRDKVAAERLLREDRDDHSRFLTGLFYFNPDTPPMADEMHVADEPLWNMPLSRLRPDAAALDAINESLR